MSKKRDLVKQIAVFQSLLFDTKFQSIGNIYKDTNSDTCRLSTIVANDLFCGDRINHDVARGPFRNNHRWLCSRLGLILEEQERILQTSDDEDDIEWSNTARPVAKDLLNILPEPFSLEANRTIVIFHDDLHDSNKLVDENGDLSAIVDCECVSGLPLWEAYQPPRLLIGRFREEEPQRRDCANAPGHIPKQELATKACVICIGIIYLSMNRLSFVNCFYRRWKSCVPIGCRSTDKGSSGVGLKEQSQTVTPG